ncbi:MAG: hypothetical protein IPK87_00060 [Planctomycetes bacterium]|nr:hypothetical protein [Planctomycetota bacterium]
MSAPTINAAMSCVSLVIMLLASSCASGHKSEEGQVSYAGSPRYLIRIYLLELRDYPSQAPTRYEHMREQYASNQNAFAWEMEFLAVGPNDQILELQVEQICFLADHYQSGLDDMPRLTGWVRAMSSGHEVGLFEWLEAEVGARRGSYEDSWHKVSAKVTLEVDEHLFRRIIITAR